MGKDLNLDSISSSNLVVDQRWWQPDLIASELQNGNISLEQVQAALSDRLYRGGAFLVNATDYIELTRTDEARGIQNNELLPTSVLGIYDVGKTSNFVSTLLDLEGQNTDGIFGPDPTFGYPSLQKQGIEPWMREDMAMVRKSWDKFRLASIIFSEELPKIYQVPKMLSSIPETMAKMPLDLRHKADSTLFLVANNAHHPGSANIILKVVGSLRVGSVYLLTPDEVRQNGVGVAAAMISRKLWPYLTPEIKEAAELVVSRIKTA